MSDDHEPQSAKPFSEIGLHRQVGEPSSGAFDPSDTPRAIRDDAPSIDAGLSRALDLVRNDLDVTLPGQGLKFVATVPGNDGSDRELWVALDDGRYWGGGCPVEEHLDSDDVLASVAECAQDAITEVLRRAWPQCPAHGRFMYVSRNPARWLCGDEAHGIGSLING